MRRTLGFALNEFDPIPRSLKDSSGQVIKTITVDLDNLFHHMFIDTYITPPRENYLGEHYKSLLANENYLRFLGESLGSHKEPKILESNRFGKAFCRWFLYRHCSMTYFEHVDNILREKVTIGDQLKLQRKEMGDTPDYFCSKGSCKHVNSIFLGEAKGTQTNDKIGTNPKDFFANKKFQDWRNQFDRVELLDKNKNPLEIKGYIVATYLANEAHPTCKSTILAEDPSSAGLPITETDRRTMRRMTIAGHYASILDKLNLSQLAVSLRFAEPEERRFRVGLWRCNEFPIQGQEFIGGYFYPPQPYTIYPTLSKKQDIQINLPLPEPFFFGLHRDILSVVRRMIEFGRSVADEMIEFNEIVGYDSQDEFADRLSLLRDGSVLGPLHYFDPHGTIEI